MRIIILAIAAILFPALAVAQDLDPQVRLLIHNHIADPGKQLGVATWTITPDLTTENLKGPNPKRLLFVAGLLVRSKTASSEREWWLEIMPGGLFEVETTQKRGMAHPLLNSRAYIRWPNADLYMENHLRKDRLLYSAFATKPWAVGKFALRWGGELEAVQGLTPNVPDLLLIGPRLSIRLHWSWLSLAEVIFVDQSGKIVPRTYIKFGK